MDVAHGTPWPRPPVAYCDLCNEPIWTDELYFHCDICLEGDFDACLECMSRKKSCLENNHSLGQRNRCTVYQPGQATEPYRYQPLPDNYIRIIQFAPLVPSAPLAFSLYKTTLALSPDYFTLSYAWSNTGTFETVICNGALMSIPSELHQIILQIHKLGLAIRFWIDSICINQEDNGEKARQVPLMADIYRNSITVIVWIGDSDELTPTAVTVLKRLASEQHRFETAEEANAPSLDASHDVRRTNLTAVERQAVVDFFARRWFMRTWVVQEVSLWGQEQTPLVFCGQHHILWLEVILAWERITHYQISGPGRRESRSAPTGCFISKNLMHRRAAKGPTSLLELLVWAQPLKATDPRDKVYAMLGLMTSTNIAYRVQHASDSKSTSVEAGLQRRESPAPTIFIDYGRDARLLYEETTRAIITSSRSLEILCFAARSPSASITLPSWVPDWSTLSPSTFMLVPGRHANNHAAGQISAKIDLRCTPGILEVEAFFCDTVAEVANTSFVDNHAQIRRLIMSLWLCFGSKLESYPDGGSPINAFWRTAMANVRSDVPEYTIPSETLEQGFLALALMMQGKGELEDLTCVRDSCAQIKICSCCGKLGPVRRCETRRLRPQKVAELGLMREAEHGMTDALTTHPNHELKNFENSFRDVGECMVQSLFRFAGQIDPEAVVYVSQFIQAVHAAMGSRRFFITERGLFGLGPPDAKPGDQIVVLKGGPLPFVVRRNDAVAQLTEAGGEETFQLVGETYVHGLSVGEAVVHTTNSEVSEDWTKIHLV